METESVTPETQNKISKLIWDILLKNEGKKKVNVGKQWQSRIDLLNTVYTTTEDYIQVSNLIIYYKNRPT